MTPKLPAVLQENASDKAAAGLRSLTSLIDVAAPGLGSLFGEMIGRVIPNQREERLAAYLGALGHKLREVHEGVRLLTDAREQMSNRLDDVEEQLRAVGAACTAEQTALFEDGAYSSQRATHADRIERIASLVADGMAEPAEAANDRRLLALLDQLGDDDILRLMSYALKYRNDLEWRKAHAHVIRPPFAPIGAPQEVQDAKTLNDFQERRLIGLGLLAERAGTTMVSISDLGRLLLRRIGLLGEGEF